MSTFHKPVLLQEIIENLKVAKDHQYIDATVGGGGHTVEILNRGGVVLGIDQDEEALNFTRNLLGQEYNSRLTLTKGNFKNIDKIAEKYGFTKVSGILFDLGISSYQVDEKSRGFSFRKEARLDMRMDKDLKVSAFEIINNEPFETLERIFLKYGEEPKAEHIAHLITKTRSHKPINTTLELAELVSKVYGNPKESGRNPATRVFQALRVAVNDEINALKEGLNKSISLLDKGGRLVVISYHSLEDRIAKFKMKNEKLKIITKKPITGSWEEIRENRRARSAKLRIAQKI